MATKVKVRTTRAPAAARITSKAKAPPRPANGSTVIKLNGSAATKVNGSTVAKVNGSAAPKTNGSVAHKANGSTLTKSKARSALAITEKESLSELLLTTPRDMDDYLSRIRQLGDRIHGYVKFMAGADKITGSCAESKSKSVAMFYDRLVAFDRELGRIQEELQLG